MRKKLGADKVTLTVDNSGTDAPKQIQAISDMIASGVNAIMINPASDTALDSIIEEACKQNIVVVSFDQGVTAPCAYNIGVDYVRARRNPCAVDGRHAQGQGQRRDQPRRLGLPGRQEPLPGHPQRPRQVSGHQDRRRSLRQVGQRGLPAGTDQGPDRQSECRWHPQPVRHLWCAAGADQPQPSADADDRAGRERLAHRHAG